MAPESVRVVVDCGAHIGLTALYFANRYPRARVIGIEPSPTNFRLLQQNTRQEPRIVPVQAAISDRSGTACVNTDGPRAGATRQAAPLAARSSKRSRSTTSAARFGIDGIDLLKLDVEGAERAVLAAGIGKVRAIAAELHEPYTLDRFARDVAPMRVATRPGHDTVIATRA